MLSSPGPVKLLRTAATIRARVYFWSMNTVCWMALSESTTSAKPMWVAPEELYTEPEESPIEEGEVTDPAAATPGSEVTE